MLLSSPAPSLYLRHHRRPAAVAYANLSSTADHESDGNTRPDLAFRIHNSKSISLLQGRSGKPQSGEEATDSNGRELEVPDSEDGVGLKSSNPHATIPPQEKLHILQLSLATKRAPQFPGSIYASSIPPLQSLVNNADSDGEDTEEMIRRALAMRRKLTVEIFKQAMRKGKFGITYSTNLAGTVQEFLDHVMIEAATMKHLPEFQHCSFNVRVRTVIDRSNVVPLIRWLKHNHFSYPKIGKLICMAKRDLESIRRMSEWLKTIHVNCEFLGAVLLKSGDNILGRSFEELSENVDYLERNGVRSEWLGYVISRCPKLLSCSLEELRSRIEFYLDMGMNQRDFGTMVFDYPGVLGRFTLEEMQQKVDYLKEFGLSIEEVGRLLAFRPQLMGCGIEERWKPLVKYFYYLGIPRAGMRRILVIKPMIFCFNLEQTIVPKVQFFRDIGIQDDAIGRMIVKFPPLLTYSLQRKIRPVAIFLMTKAGVHQKDIGKVIALGPELLACRIGKRLEVNVKFFLSLGIRLRQLGEMIADFPKLLRYKVDLLRPKYQYLRRAMVRPLEDVIEFPRFFSYSLEDRIIPRHQIMVENQINFKLRYMLACTDERFDVRVAEKVERRQKFESGMAVSSEFLSDDSLESGEESSEDSLESVKELAEDSLESVEELSEDSLESVEELSSSEDESAFYDSE